MHQIKLPPEEVVVTKKKTQKQNAHTQSHTQQHRYTYTISNNRRGGRCRGGGEYGGGHQKENNNTHRHTQRQHINTYIISNDGRRWSLVQTKKRTHAHTHTTTRKRIHHSKCPMEDVVETTNKRKQPRTHTRTHTQQHINAYSISNDHMGWSLRQQTQ